MGQNKFYIVCVSYPSSCLFLIIHSLSALSHLAQTEALLQDTDADMIITRVHMTLTLTPAKQPDNDVTEDTDKRRMLWSVGDAVYGRQPLSRWRDEYKQESVEWMKNVKLEG